MSRQWLTETYLRFGARAFHHIDCKRVVEESRASLLRLVGSPRVIVSTTALATHPELVDHLISRRWDMIVVDEAHQIPPGSVLYPALERLASQSDGLLLLSATPSKRDLAGLKGLLALVAPVAYRDQPPEALQAKYERQSAVWDRLNFTRKLIDATAVEGRTLDSDELDFIADEWAGLIDGDEFFNDAGLVQFQGCSRRCLGQHLVLGDERAIHVRQQKADVRVPNHRFCSDTKATGRQARSPSRSNSSAAFGPSLPEV
jgi:hypothetical protein